MSDAARFVEWARVADAVRATTRRTEKVAALAAYLVRLDGETLAVSARFFAGVVFARHDRRTTQVGPALLWRALSAVSGIEPAALSERYVAHGDAGDLAAEVLAGRPDGALTVDETGGRFAGLAAAGDVATRHARLCALMESLGAAEARFVVRLLGGELRIGLKEAQVEEAIAQAFGRPLDAVRRANLLRGDVGEVAVLARADALETARLALFHPLGFMLAQPLASAAEVVAALPAPFALEDKYDGIRAQAHVTAGRVVLFSRTLDDVTHGYPDVLPALATLGEGLVLDGELLAFDPADAARALPFRALQERLGRQAA